MNSYRYSYRLSVIVALLLPFVILTVGTASAKDVKITQEDYMIDGADPGIRLSVREKYPEGMTDFRSENVVVFVHGATYPCIPDFDLSVPGYSWMNYMAERGFDAVCFDIRGYGASTRPKEMDEPAANNKPIVRASVVIRDIGAVVDHIREKRGVDKVSIIGWSWGAMSSPLYATIHPEKVHRLVLYAPMYGYKKHPVFGHGSGLEDPERPGHINPKFGAYRLRDDAGTTARWDKQIVPKNKDAWRDPEVLRAYLKENLDSDPTSNDRKPPSHRAPNGVLIDAYMGATGRPLYDASNLTVPTLIIKGESDPWAQEADVVNLFHQITRAPMKRLIIIGDTSHFMTLERKHLQLWEESYTFLTD